MSAWVRELQRIGNSGLSLLFPRACDLCQGSVEALRDGVACNNCWNETELVDGSVSLCSKCGSPSGTPGTNTAGVDLRCRRCDDDAFSAARALGPYAAALRASVLALKRRPELGARLLDLLTALAATEPLKQADLIVPVPLHPERERERGFNQAAVLAEGLSRRTGLAADDTSLIRVQHTARHRAEMDARARRESVETVFSVAHPRRIKGSSVLLVDDVLTTGATVSACARVLLDAGATNVFALTIARTRS